MEIALILGPICLIGAATDAVVALKRERTGQLQAEDPPPTELLERVARLERLLSEVVERQQQLEDAVDWQQKLLERPERDGRQAPE
ncbi:MAG: hypothetical protein CL878_01125 [Dehalococcoidia bacterium]|nr:hypothetical protein [Dehalococcoidia bacterium]